MCDDVVHCRCLQHTPQRSHIASDRGLTLTPGSTPDGAAPGRAGMTAHVSSDPSSGARVSDPSTWPEHIRQRYGITSRRSRTPLVIVGVVILFMSPLLARYAWRSGTEQGVLTMTRYEVESPTSVLLEFSYPGRERGFICAVRAQDTERADVGYAYIPLPAGPQRLWEYRLTTVGRAALASVLACQPGAVPTRLPAPQFPPGVKPPAQPPPGLTPRVDGGFATVRP